LLVREPHGQVGLDARRRQRQKATERLVLVALANARSCRHAERPLHPDGDVHEAAVFELYGRRRRIGVYNRQDER
jgi:hypothetical protein